MKQRIIITAIALVVYCSIARGQSAYVDSLQQVIALNKHDDAEMRAYVLLANDFFQTNPAKAKNYMLQLVKLATDANNYDRLAAAYTVLLAIYNEEGDIDSAGYYINMMKGVAGKAPDHYRVQANSNQAIGLYYRKNGDYKTALPYSLAAVKFAELTSPGEPYLGGQWLNAGDVYMGLGEYNKAMDCNLKALRIFEKSGSKQGEAFCYTNMSFLYNLLKQYGNALTFAQKSLELKRQLNDNRGVCTAIEAVGQANMNMKNWSQAFSNYEAALKISLAEKMPLEEMECYFNMGKIAAAQNKDSLAITYFKKSKGLAIQLENRPIAANVEVELAALYKNADSLKHTEATLFTSLKTFKETGSLEKESDSYKRLADFYAANKQYDKALDYSNKYHTIKDSISGANVQVQLKKLEEQYNSEKKENEITLLKKDKELQQQRLSRQRVLFGAAAALLILALLGIVLLVNRSRLRQRMKELELRNQIAADLHDEVGSSLSSIHMLSQMATVQNDEDNNQKNILDKVNTNAKETMDRMSDIVWMIKPGESDGGSLRQRMERFANEICSSKNIELTTDLSAMENIKPTMAQRKNVYLIFKEAINNAVKYSGSERIEVKATIQNKQLELAIKDFGKGFEQSAKARGNGLDNMKNRAKESGGTLAIDSTEGTAVTLLVHV